MNQSLASKWVIGAALFYFVSLAILFLQLFRASPPPAFYPVSGVGIQDENGCLHFYGRSLTCQFNKNQPYPADCTIDLAGNLLEIQVGRLSLGTSQPYSLTCTAVFNGEPLPCHNDLRHSGRIPPTHIFLDEPLNLSATEIKQLRQRFWLENLPEYPYRQGRWIISLFSMGVAIVGFHELFAHQWPTRTKNISLALIGIFAYQITFVVSFILTAPLWD